ncbi:non-hydrolyzing UDP-N-acetylglucosamine 2-epimerase [Roseibium aggregatum]|uniref:non-hydrolyzing UDP-N-acetylglucosamine 2-epimerase n=1 Tax=Roseibium aggregatum TaxID=187304 RepID=UPI0025AD9B65|nr:UDP-N-acetylglucosamine 2-epimerase (non-hydrolyzing) [Roseibium aggregatum]WJS01664.1 UDP-N-acetylglucosamine 2-epimerase (non-hydrolyzing) [Roseibium aggregatum]
MIHVAVIVGTRPEGIKMAPVVHALRADKRFKCTLVSTGQHKEMLQSALEDFGLEPDIDLSLMQPGQTLGALSGRLFLKVDELLGGLTPDWVLVQGDTTTVMIASLCAFYRGIRVGHVEAGLRSHNLRAPFPEELNRRVAGSVSDLHFAPTQASRQNLLKEGVSDDTIFVTGNTGIDALLKIASEVRVHPPKLDEPTTKLIGRYARFVLITGHRRENFGEGFKNICKAITRLAEEFPDIGFLYPVHLNPNVREPVHSIIKYNQNVALVEPQEYRRFIYLMDRAYLLLSDSGGVQEEAPSLGKPVLVMREVTERPEGIEAGCAELVGATETRIFDRVSHLLRDAGTYNSMAKAQNPYGDGQASQRVISALANL